MLGRMAGLAIVALLLASCARTSPPAASACGEVTRLAAFPGSDPPPYPNGTPWHGVLIGPLFFSAFGPDTNRAVIGDYAPGRPTKVVIQQTTVLTAPVSLAGRNCATGQRVHFVYDAPYVEGAAGNATWTFYPTDPPKVLAHTGYMLFGGTGKWRIAVRLNGKELGTAIFQVT